MKSRSFSWLWIFAIPLSIGLVALSPEEGNVLLLLALPFTAAGNILRELSLSGELGNWVAIGLYAAVCVSPLILIRKSDSARENLLLVLATAVLFRVMWLMVNPNMMPAPMRNEVGKSIYAGAVYSVFVTWGITKLMLKTDLSEQGKIYKALRVFLAVCATLFLVSGFGVGISSFRADLNRLTAENTLLSENQLMPSIMFLTAEFTFRAAESVLMAWILFLAFRLVLELEEDPYSQRCHDLSCVITLWCRRTIRVVAASNLAMNLGQVLLAGKLVNVDVVLHLPVVSLAVTFGMMALTRLLDQGKALKEDNELFV